jgi:general L-amino acid transport system substrate-binding protein
MMKKVLMAATAMAVVSFAGQASATETLAAVKEKGFLQCGVNTALAGFSSANTEGVWEGLDVEFCRSVAAAIFDDPEAVRFTPLTGQQRFTALQSGEIDVLARNSTWTITRDTNLGLNFVGVNFYDGQGFLIPKSLGVTSATELDGATVCVEPGTTTELNLADYFRANGMSFEPVVIENINEATKAFVAGRCDVYTTDTSGLASVRLFNTPNPDDYTILPEVISKEPLGPVVRHSDDQWFDIIKWTFFAQLEAEELGVTSENVDEMMSSTNPAIKRLLGTTPGMGEALGLTDDWAVRFLKTMGNYGESYQRNVTDKIGLPRGYNDLWTRGGLMYAPPIR